jgi:hypothetical protein
MKEIRPKDPKDKQEMYEKMREAALMKTLK